MPTAEDNRSALLSALEADLIGPFYPLGSPRDEVLTLPPSRWYWAGFLAPYDARETEDPTSDDEGGAGSDEDDEESTGQEQEPKQKKAFSASLGLSVLLRAPTTADRIRVTVRFADYLPERRETDAGGPPRIVWKRVARGPVEVDLPLDAKALHDGVPLPSDNQIRLEGQLQPAEAPGLPPSTRALSLFLVNHRLPGPRGEQDASYLFQVQLELATRLALFRDRTAPASPPTM